MYFFEKDEICVRLGLNSRGNNAYTYMGYMWMWEWKALVAFCVNIVQCGQNRNVPFGHSSAHAVRCAVDST